MKKLFTALWYLIFIMLAASEFTGMTGIPAEKWCIATGGDNSSTAAFFTQTSGNMDVVLVLHGIVAMYCTMYHVNRSRNGYGYSLNFISVFLVNRVDTFQKIVKTVFWGREKVLVGYVNAVFNHTVFDFGAAAVKCHQFHIIILFPIPIV